MTMLERFIGKVDFAPSGCWEWTAGIASNGYGKFAVTHRKTAGAHRVSYELFVGAIPDGLQLDHLCRNRKCVNPSHLEPVTPTVNQLRGIAGAEQKARTHCPKGHEYTPENTYHHGPEHRWRRCRRCSIDRVVAIQRRNKVPA